MLHQQEIFIDPDDYSRLVHQVFLGKQRIVSHEGISQYQSSGGSSGMSACGLAALNCARIAFQKECDGVIGEDLLHHLLKRQTAEDITSICTHWDSAFHLDMDDILLVPLFSKSLRLVHPPTYFSQCDFHDFKNLLLDLQVTSPSSSAAVMITRPPEIIACLRIPTSAGDVFLVFDSHTRPNHPSGAGFILNTSLDETARYLSTLLTIDQDLLSADGDAGFQWQIDLMRQFCGHILVSTGSTPDNLEALTQAVLESSIMLLTLKAELAAVKQENSFLTTELEKLKKPPKTPRREEFTRSPPHHDTPGTSGTSVSPLPVYKRVAERLTRSATDRGQWQVVGRRSARRKVKDKNDDDHHLAVQLQSKLNYEAAVQLSYEEEARRLAAKRKEQTSPR